MQSPDQSNQHTVADGQTIVLKRSMTKRHLIMLSLGGAIGTGLFLSSGEVIAQAGPIGAVIAYIIGGLIAYMVMLCLGELAVNQPVTGSFGAFAAKNIGPGTGYMVSWMYWLGWSATLGTEFTAAAMLMQEWFPNNLNLVMDLGLYWGSPNFQPNLNTLFCRVRVLAVFC